MKKQRNSETAKSKRAPRRSKASSEANGDDGTPFVYFQFVFFWLLVLVADFALAFRLEYLWPLWTSLLSVRDSFKFRGLASSLFLVCVTLASDAICYVSVPPNWLTFAASANVWVGYVWQQTEGRGFCLPTLALWSLFLSVEAAVRSGDLRHLDLCGPFAAHCVGYPAVTLCLGMKTYLGSHMRRRRRKDVARENEFYAKLLQHAINIDLPQQM